MSVYYLNNNPTFPPIHEAEPDGLLAIGGDLSAERLIEAYASGVFPWPYADFPLMWFSPDPRCITLPQNFKLSKSFKSTLRKGRFEIRIDHDFDSVIRNCSTISRKDETETWITEDIIEAYTKLHEIGLAHSVETYLNNKLVGGLYGISLGKVFMGESMFHKVSDASKVAFFALCKLTQEKGFHFIDNQMPTDHLLSLGAETITRNKYMHILNLAIQEPTWQGSWAKAAKPINIEQI